MTTQTTTLRDHPAWPKLVDENRRALRIWNGSPHVRASWLESGASKFDFCRQQVSGNLTTRQCAGLTDDHYREAFEEAAG